MGEPVEPSDTKFVVVYACILALGLGLILSSCAPWQSRTDHLGNPWPPECRHDLTAETAYVPIHRVPRETMVLNGRPVDGLTYSFGVRGDELITIADDLEGEHLAAVLQHERCHVVAGAWHP